MVLLSFYFPIFFKESVIHRLEYKGILVLAQVYKITVINVYMCSAS